MEFIKLGLAVIETEAQAVHALAARLDQNFESACRLLLACTGRVVVLGMGKSGHIARKIAATLASTGTPAFFVHPGEANHGDMGMITKQDVVLALSSSGETQEVITLIPLIKRLQVPLVALCGNPRSTLARSADVILNVTVDQEACPLGLAPTASTTVALVMGDALAIALLQARGFTTEDFARSHPGGALGKRLLLLADDLLHKDEQIPRVKENAIIRDALIEMTEKKLGMTLIVDEQNHLKGIYTDGDLRRTLDKGIDVHKAQIKDVMTTKCKVIKPHTLAYDALNLMRDHKITSLVAVKEDQTVLGVLHLHDLLRAGVA